MKRFIFILSVLFVVATVTTMAATGESAVVVSNNNVQKADQFAGTNITGAANDVTQCGNTLMAAVQANQLTTGATMITTLGNANEMGTADIVFNTLNLTSGEKYLIGAPGIQCGFNFDVVNGQTVRTGETQTIGRSIIS